MVGNVPPIVDRQIVRATQSSTVLDERVHEIRLTPVRFATVDLESHRLGEFPTDTVGNLLQ